MDGLDILLLTIIVCCLIAIVAVFVWVRRERKEDAAGEDPDLVYKRRPLLTQHELQFYRELKPVADELGLSILAKIRMADLVQTVAGDGREYYRGFGKVKAKHIDFALCRPGDLQIVLLIELDDSTHEPGNERDAFVEAVYSQVGYRLFRTYDSYNLKERIKAALR